MIEWPNWLDWLIVTVVFLTSYNGFSRGVILELLHLAGAVGVTAITINYAPVVVRWIGPFAPWLKPDLKSFLLFWACFLVALFVGRRILRFFEGIIRSTASHWITLGLGLVAGAFRGLWWCGLLLIAFHASGVDYLMESEMGSRIGSRMFEPSRAVLRRVCGYFPGADNQLQGVVPPLKYNK